MFTFVVYAPDYTEEGTLEKRLNVRAQHLERIKEMKEAEVMSKFWVIILYKVKITNRYLC